MSKYKLLREHLESAKSLQPVNEILMTLVAGAILCHCLTPALNTEGGKAITGGIGALFRGVAMLFGYNPPAENGKSGGSGGGGGGIGSFLGLGPKSDDKKDDKKDDKESVDLNSDESKDVFKSLVGWCGTCGGKEEEYGKDVAGVLLDEDGNVKDMPLSKEDAKKLAKINKTHGKEDYDPETLLEDAKTAFAKNPEVREQAIKDGHNMTVAKLERDFKQEQDALKKDYNKKMKGKSDDEKKKLEDELKEKLAAAEKAHNDRVKAQEAARDKALQVAKDAEKDTKKDAEDDDPKKDTETEKDPKKDTETEKDPKKDTETEKDTKKDTETEKDTKKDTETEKDTKKDTETEKDTKKDTETEKDTKKDTETEKDTKKDAGSESEKEVGTVTHNGQETKIIKRPNKREPGKYVYCYANDRDTTVSPDDMKGVKESQYTSLRDWLRLI